MSALVNVSYYVQAIDRQSPWCEALCPELVKSMQGGKEPKVYIYRVVLFLEAVPAARIHSVGCGPLKWILETAEHFLFL
jgi:hypothetical protein